MQTLFESCAEMHHPYHHDDVEDEEGRCLCGDEIYPLGGWRLPCSECEGSGIVFEERDHGDREALGCQDCQGTGTFDSRWLWSIDNVKDQLDALTQTVEGAGCDAIRLVISALWHLEDGDSLDYAFLKAKQERINRNEIEGCPS